MKPAKDDLALSIEPLRPEADTTVAIRAAFFRLKAAREANAAEISSIEAARRGSMILTATAAEIARADASLQQRRIFAEQVDLLEPELRRMFDAALDREEAAAYAASLEQVTAKAEAWNLNFLLRYPVLAGELVALLRQEQEISEAYRDLWKLPGAERFAAGPEAHRRATAPAYLSPRPEWGPPASFAETVVLPALVQGNPLWRGQRWAPHA